MGVQVRGSAEKPWYIVYGLAVIGILYILLTFANIWTFFLIELAIYFILGFIGIFIVTFIKTKSLTKSIAAGIAFGSFLYFFRSRGTPPSFNY